jgi:hypothetical protein
MIIRNNFRTSDIFSFFQKILFYDFLIENIGDRICIWIYTGIFVLFLYYKLYFTRERSVEWLHSKKINGKLREM